MIKYANFRKAISLFLAFALAFMISPSVFAANDTQEIKLKVNGNYIEPEVPAQIINNRTMVPIRFIAEALGNTVDWDAKKRIVLVDSSSIKADETVDTTIRLFVAGKEITPDVPPQIIDGRAMVPVRFVAEALGADVEWDSKTYTVIINKITEKYGYVRQIKKQGKVVLELEPDELFIFTTEFKPYEYSHIAREKAIGQFIKEKFPNLKFKLIHWDDELGIRDDDFIANGVYPDI